MNLSSTIKSIQDIMRKDDGVDGDAQRIGQLTWMLFLKVFDQREEEWEEENPKYKSPIPTVCRWRNWATYFTDSDGKKKPQKDASKIIEFVDETLFPQLREIVALNQKNITKEKDKSKKSEYTQKCIVIQQVFKDTHNHMKSGTLMLGVLDKLNEAIDFHNFTTRQHLGDIYEQILSDLRAAGNAGEFYTPRAITQVMVQLVNPKLFEGEVVLDPACGTGGFLTATLDHLREQFTSLEKTVEKEMLNQAFKGIEKKSLPHLLCTTNLLLHGIDIPSQVERKNTLNRPWDAWTESDMVNCVITNPPFGGMEDDGVGADYPTEFRTRETADMFLSLIVSKLLKHGGRAAIVLPDGFLFGEGVKNKIKELLLTECNLHTIIRLPNGVFSPYTSIKTNLLFFTKGNPTETIWFYEHKYPAGYKNYSKTKPIVLKEFDAVKSWWGNENNSFSERIENEHAWKIDFKRLKQDAQVNAKVHLDKAIEQEKKLNNLEKEINKLKNSLKNQKPKDRRHTESQIENLIHQTNQLEFKIRDSRLVADQIYWSVYNLDVKKKKILNAEIHDPELILKKYKDLIKDVESTQKELKQELSTILAHHFESVDN